MKYIILLRKINVGKSNRVDKKTLEKAFTALGYSGVEIYINSGNVFLLSTKGRKSIRKDLEIALEALFKTHIDFLVKTNEEMETIGKAIPKKWENNSEQRTDVFFLFPEIDRPELKEELPIKKEYVKLKYIKGALIINVQRENVYKSHYSNIIASEAYKFMTIRNVNTARYLSGIDR
jgi:uncharacterized protein (DUF1697 family)